jgi:hypothetical protein
MARNGHPELRAVAGALAAFFDAAARDERPPLGELARLIPERGANAYFVRAGRAAVCPTPRLVRALRELRPERPDAGFVPCVVTPVESVRERDALAEVASGLNAHPELGGVETHAFAGGTTSLFLVGATTLAAALESADSAAPDVAAAYDHCLRSLVRFVEVANDEIVDRLRRAGHPVRDFDFLLYLRRASEWLDAWLGAAAPPPPDWRNLAERLSRMEPRALLYDPKPANFILSRRALRHGGIGRARISKIDLDWMLVRAPVVHQAAIAVLSYPIPAPASDVAAEFDRLCGLASRAVAHLGGTEDEVRLAAFYHLYRNFASRVERLRGRDRRSAAEAANLAPFLEQAAAHLDVEGDRRAAAQVAAAVGALRQAL